MDPITNFISELSLVRKSGDTTNLYSGDSRESKIRRNNLEVYLTIMKDLEPTVLLLGEAPGHKGCRLSGIPFTSERVLAENPFFRNKEIQFINEPANLESEISATIVWGEISKLDIKPLIWNIFPFHPHSANDVKTNRTPTTAELEEGKEFLEKIVALFPIKKILALGRKPQSQLAEIGLPFSYIRHPANGGKAEFVKGIRPELGPWN